MLKKTIVTAAAALAITTGAVATNATDANAGVKVHVGFGHGYYAPYYGPYGYGYGYWGPHCYTKIKKYKKKVWTKWGPKKIWVKKPVKVCY
jgi:hypothetical protein